VDWDDANLTHIARHNVTADEAERVLTGATLPLQTDERDGENV
jgi:hypothetical protein